MGRRLASILVPSGLAAVGVALIVLWIGAGPSARLLARVPGLDGVPIALPAKAAVRPVPGEPRSAPRDAPRRSSASGLASAARTTTRSIRSPFAWRGIGPPAARGGSGASNSARVTPRRRSAAGASMSSTTSRDQPPDGADMMRCLSLDDGKELWRNGYAVSVPPHHGMSRTIPAVAGKWVVSLGPKCQVVCWDADSGAARWLIDLALDYEATVPPWYAGQCPLIDAAADRLILAPGGKALLLAVDYRSGKVLWESPNPHGWAMTHASIVPMELAGRRMYVYCGKGGVAGVSADDGAILWETADWQIATATCPSPVVLGDGRVFLTGGYNAGSLMLKIERQGDRLAARTLFRLAAAAVQFRAADADLLRRLPLRRAAEGRAAGLPRRGREGALAQRASQVRLGAVPDCRRLDLRDERRRHAVDGRGDRGRLPAACAAQAIPGGVTCWGPMALAAGRLIVRDFTRMVCLDVAEKRP